MTLLSKSPYCSSILLCCLLLLTGITSSSALRFYLQDRERRCFKIDTPPSTRIIGHKSVDNGKGSAELSIDVKTTTGKRVYETTTRDTKSSHFAFTSPPYDGNHGHNRDYEDYDDYDDYYDDYEDDYDVVLEICLMLTFDSHMHNAEGKRGVTFWVRPEKEGEDVDDSEKVKLGTVLQISRKMLDMQNSLQVITRELVTLRQREARLVHRHQSNAKHLYLLAIISVIVMIGTSTLQFLHFKKYFHSKKLI